jgi:hypothetical protein
MPVAKSLLNDTRREITSLDVPLSGLYTQRLHRKISWRQLSTGVFAPPDPD